MTNFSYSFAFSSNYNSYSNTSNSYQLPPKHLVMGDLNNNQKLDPVEQQRMQFIDRNGNGMIDPQEHQWEMQNFDINGNNRLDPNELFKELNTAAQMKNQGQQGPPPPPPPQCGQGQRPPQNLIMGDLNNNQKLDPIEQQRMQIVDRNGNGRIDPQEHQWEMQNFDKNGNNRLDPNELRNELQSFSQGNQSQGGFGNIMNMLSSMMNMFSNIFSQQSGSTNPFC